MKKYLFIPVFLFFQFILHFDAYSQAAQHPKNNPYTDDFVPGENVVFYDDFSGYKEGGALPVGNY